MSPVLFKENVLRITLVAINFIFAILSIALIGLGCVYIDDLSFLTIFVDNVRFLQLPILLIVLGVLSFIASLMGCFFARTNSKECHLKLFIVLLFILLAAEALITCMAFLNLQTPIDNDTVEAMKEQLGDSEQSDRFHYLEEHLHCCGILGPSDYSSHTYVLPADSICAGALDDSLVFEADGCAKEVCKNIKKIVLEIGCIAAIYAGLQVIDIICLLMMLLIKG